MPRFVLYGLQRLTSFVERTSFSQSPVEETKITVLIAKATDVFDRTVPLRLFINLTSMDNQQKMAGDEMASQCSAFTEEQSARFTG